MSEAAVKTVERPEVPQIERSGIVLVGQPNVGKSALFGVLTGSYVTVSNYPGTTVEITRGIMHLEGQRVEVVDTPGTHSFNPTSEDERVTRDVLLQSPPETVVAVGDAKNLERTLTLAMQLGEMEVPFVLCLNMMDEARARGITIDDARLAEEIGVEVVPTVAIERKGIPRLRSAIKGSRTGRIRVSYPEPLEHAIDKIAPLLPAAPISERSLALMVLSGDKTLVDWLRERVDPATLGQIEDVRQGVRRAFRDPLRYVINQARFHAAGRLAADVTSRRDTGGAGHAQSRWLDRVTVHPVWGIPFLAAVLFLTYKFVGELGAGTLVDILETTVFGEWINPWAIAFADRFIPWAWLRDLLVGDYGIITMALTYSLALIFPIVGTFFIAFSVLEDSGYLPRLAVLVNRGFKKIGLNGKAVLPMVLGLGCGTMATLTTRILATRRERLIVIVLLALGIPCSAQLTVILAMLASLSLAAMFVWIAVVFGVIVLVGSLAARIVRGRTSDFVLELPPLRVPRPMNILIKTAARIEWYLKEAVPLFILGTLILFVTDRIGLLRVMERAAEPVLTTLLGLPGETAGTFIIGFLRRDFGAAGIYEMMKAGQLDAVQVTVAAVTITLFIPCIAHFFMMVKERGWKTGLIIASFIFPFAVAVGATLNWVLRTFPIVGP
jgi:ferrous iron transport protein B